MLISTHVYKIAKAFINVVLSFLYYLGLVRVIVVLGRLDSSFFRVGYSSYFSDFLFRKDHTLLALSLTEYSIFRFREKRINVNLPQAEEPLKVISKTKFLEMFQIFSSISTKLGYKPFLVFGTLLGAVRESGFIKWDKDLDIGLFYDEIDVNELVSAFKKYGFTVEKKGQPNYLCGLKLYLKSYPNIDIVFFRKKSGYLETSFIIQNNYIYRKRKVFDIVPFNFKNIDIFIPRNPKEFLIENYGNWQTPKPIYHFIFDSALTDFSDIRINYLAKNYLLKLLIKGYEIEFKYYLDLFKIKFPEDTFFQNYNI